MNSSELKRKFEELLLKACEVQFPKLLNDLEGHKIFAYTLYCSAGCRSFGVAVATDRDMVSNKEKTLFNAAEWKYVNKNFLDFSDVDSFVDELYRIFYEEELSDVNLDEMDDDQLWLFISTFFVDSIVNVLTIMKNKKRFQLESFIKDVFIGLQFGDPDEYALDMMKKVSLKLNDDALNKRLISFFHDR